MNLIQQKKQLAKKLIETGKTRWRRSWWKGVEIANEEDGWWEEKKQSARSLTKTKSLMRRRSLRQRGKTVGDEEIRARASDALPAPGVTINRASIVLWYWELVLPGIPFVRICEKGRIPWSRWSYISNVRQGAMESDWHKLTMKRFVGGISGLS